MMDERYLLVGLGNPGRKYKTHRHNIGFMLLDRLAAENDLSFSRLQHQALVVIGRLADRPVILAKPQTFMNDSGRAVSQLLRFYQIPLDHLLVAFDDLDLPLGTVRFRPAGGAGGQKGMRSIIESLGSQAFSRVRLGIGRPPGQMDPAAYVLRPFRGEEASVRDLVLVKAAAGVVAFLQDGIALAMSWHNGSVVAEPDESAS